MSEMSGHITRALKIEQRLVEWYNSNPSWAAAICDKDIDRSGNLLGWLRESAAALKSQDANG